MSASPTDTTRIGPYRVVEQIGEGGMGVVHLAVSADGGLVAVKTLRPWLVGGHDGRARFEREVATLRRVRGTRVAAVVDADVTADPPYVVTRYVRGPSLAKVVADHGPLRADALDRLARGLLEALGSVHASGIVHRDVKPGNVLLADDGPVLIDFGLAHAVDETRLTAVGFVAGTPGYLAPETVLGQPITPSTDVHGWAATLAFAATGRPPYGAGPDAVVLDRIRRGDLDLDGLAPTLLETLRPALRTDPAARPTLAELARALGGPDLEATVVVSPSKAVTVATPLTTPPKPSTVPPAPTVPPTPAPSVGPADATVVLGRVSPPTRVDVAPGAAPAAPAAPPSGGPAPVRHNPQPQPQRQPQFAGGRPPGAGEGAPLRQWPARLSVALAAVALLALLGAAPYVGALVVIAALVLGRVVWRVRRRLYERRVARGVQKNDSLVAGVAAPVDVLAALPAAVAQGALVLASGLIIGAAVAVGGSIDLPFGDRAPYLAGGAMTLLLAWWGPGAARFRHGIRVLAAPLERSPRAAWIVCGLFAALAWVFVVVWESYGTSWWPGSGPPNPFG